MTDYHWPPVKPGQGQPLVRYTPVDPNDTDLGSLWVATFHPTGAQVTVTLSRERQYPGLRWGNEHIHAPMYEWAARKIGSTSVLMDYGCGSGWGMSVLAQVAHDMVIGFDSSHEAINFARRAFPGVYEMPTELTSDCYDHGLRGVSAIVAIESIEHVEDDVDLCIDWRKCVDPGERLYLTTPDASLRPPGYQLTPYHVREYTRGELADLLERTGWRVVEWAEWKGDVTMGVIAEAV